MSYVIFPQSFGGSQGPSRLVDVFFCNQVRDEKLLAVRRAVRNLVDCPAAVCSVCVLLRNKEEHPPPGYRVIREVKNELDTNASFLLMCTLHN